MLRFKPGDIVQKEGFNFYYLILNHQKGDEYGTYYKILVLRTMKIHNNFHISNNSDISSFKKIGIFELFKG